MMTRKLLRRTPQHAFSVYEAGWREAVGARFCGTIAWVKGTKYFVASHNAGYRGVDCEMPEQVQV